MLDETFIAWLEDLSRDEYRAYIIEVEHTQGILYFGSQPWLSDEQIAYDDWIIEAPTILESLDDPVAVGSFQAINPILDDAWEEYNWRGQACRIYYGDVSWKKEQWQLIISSLVEAVVKKDETTYQFDLVDHGYKLEFKYGVDDFLKGTVENILTQIMQNTSFDSFSLDDMQTWQKDLNIQIETKRTMTYKTIIEKIMESTGAYYRFTALGGIEFLSLDTEFRGLVCGQDDIIMDSLSQQSIIPAYKRLRIEYSTEQTPETVTEEEEIEDPETGEIETKTVTKKIGSDAEKKVFRGLIDSETGDIDETLEVSTSLYIIDDVTVLYNYLKNLYKTEKEIWTAEMLEMTNSIRVGDKIKITLDNFDHTVHVLSIDRTYSTLYNPVELIKYDK